MASIRAQSFTRSLPDISKIQMISADSNTSPTKTKSNNNSNRPRSSLVGKLLRYVSVQPQVKRRSAVGSPDTPNAHAQITEFERLPGNVHRLRLCKQNLNENFGLYIRDGYGTSITETTDDNTPRVAGVFVSRVVPGGLAESSGLFGINDEILDVNNIEVIGKPLTEVYKIMLSSISNMTLTIRYR
jgi:C-terminal processing protease CtpA/Prc